MCSLKSSHSLLEIYSKETIKNLPKIVHFSTVYDRKKGQSSKYMTKDYI